MALKSGKNDGAPATVVAVNNKLFIVSDSGISYLLPAACNCGKLMC